MPSYKFSDIVKWTAKQELACKEADSHRFPLYGGAGGGGKSFWLRWYSIKWLLSVYKKFGLRGVQAGLFCEDYPTLKDRHLGKIELELPSWMGKLKEDKAYGLCVKMDHGLGGGVLMLRNLDDPSKFKSTEFGLTAVDELTRNPSKDLFDDLRFRLRWPGLTMKWCKFIAGTNPGEIGHKWVKDLWIERLFPPEEEEPEEFVFIPAKVTDNPHIDQNYIKSLSSLPPIKKKALLEGSWDTWEGQYFVRFDRTIHVVPQVDARSFPQHWARIRMIDVSGMNGYTSCLWAVIDQNADVWVYREYFGTGLDSDQHAKNIWEASHWIDERGNVLGEDYKYTVMDSAAWAKMGLSETTAEVYLRTWNEMDIAKGTSSNDALMQATKDRVMGWDIVNQYLRHDPDNGEVTKLKIMDNCRNLIRTFPLLIVDDKNSNDVKDMPGTDDLLDALRYGLVTLRMQRSEDSPKVSESLAEKKLREMKEHRELQAEYDYSYTKK